MGAWMRHQAAAVSFNRLVAMWRRPLGPGNRSAAGRETRQGDGEGPRHWEDGAAPVSGVTRRLTNRPHIPYFIFYDNEVMGDMGGKKANVFRRLREAQMLSKTELARKAGLSVLTIDRVEQGKSCRISTQRKILAALGLTPSEMLPVLEGAGAVLDVTQFPAGAPLTKGEKGAEARGLFPGLRVLFVVDDDWMREVLTDRLQYWGCKVEVAASREEAIQRYAQARPHLVLLDLGGGGKDGFETGKMIQGKDPDAAILLLSSPSDTSMARKALRDGVVKVAISKPFYLEQLQLAIQEAIRKPRLEPVLPSKKEVVA